MATPESSATGYITVADLFLFKDWRQIADWCSDIEIRPSKASLMDPTSPAGKVVQAAIEAASGELEAECFVGRRYSPADLAALTGSSARHMKAIVSALALYTIAYRRHQLDAIKEVPGYKAAREQLASLRKGETVFGLAQQLDAGVGIDAVPMVVDDERRTVNAARRFFGDRLKRG